MSGHDDVWADERAAARGARDHSPLTVRRISGIPYDADNVPDRSEVEE